MTRSDINGILFLCGEGKYPSYLYEQYYIKYLHLFVFGVAKFDENMDMDNPYFRYFRISPMEFPLCLMILWRWHRMHRKELIEPDF